MDESKRVFLALMKRALPLLLLTSVACASATAPRAPERPLFAFQSHFWLNLHHFARSVGRGMPTPAAELSAAERSTWDDGVAFYRDRYSQRGLLGDSGMIEIKEALRAVEGTTSLGAAPVDPELKATLERLAPVYRAHWWPAHDAANRSWIDAMQPLLSRHGADLSRRIAASYGRTWPDTPVAVDLSVTAGAVGAYTTVEPTHVMIASTDDGYRGLAGLEMLFHEASHGWGIELINAIGKASAARQKTVPPGLWHAVLFYNAGELTRRTLLEDGVSDYMAYAVQHNLYPNLCGDGCRELIAKHWDPHLESKASLEEALDALVAAWP
jgi:hypothetical protein